MCVRTREAKAPFRAEHSMGVTYVDDAEGRTIAAMAAPAADTRGPLTPDEMKQWIADNTAMLLVAPRLIQYIRNHVIYVAANARYSVEQHHLMPELQLLADARNTSVEFEWEQIKLAIEAEGREARRVAA